MMSYLVQHYLDKSNTIYPENIAIACENIKLHYRQLYELSNHIAHSLLHIGTKRQDRVAIFLERSVNTVIAIIGVIKADAIYVPIDSKTPAERFKKIIDDCKPTSLICDKKTIVKVYDHFPDDINIFILNEKHELQNERQQHNINLNNSKMFSKKPPQYKNIADDIAYILYTSGSTGEPKGVMVSHRNIISYIEWAVDCFQLKSNDKILCTAPFHFDMSTFDIYCALKCGGMLYIAQENLLLFPKNILNCIEENEITCWKGISSLFMYIARTCSLPKNSLKKLSKIIFAGENLPTTYLLTWMTAYPDKKFYNGYGPTEATGISLYYHVTKPPASSMQRIPIGQPCANTEIFLLKEDGSLADIYETAELCIRGSGLSPGYWQDQKMTNQAFIQNPFSSIPGDRIYKTGDLALLNKEGDYELVGRKDTQIKSMGYRIDLTEIENGLIATKKIHDAAVLQCWSKKYMMHELIAVVVTNSVKENNLKENIKHYLPAYMIPHKYIFTDNIPRNDRGKIDRKKLYELYNID